MVRIRIQPHGTLLTVSGPARLVDLIDDLPGAGFPLSCRGGRCGVCRVRVALGAESFEPASAREAESLHFCGAPEGERMGCQLTIRADASGEAELFLSEAAR